VFAALRPAMTLFLRKAFRVCIETWRGGIVKSLETASPITAGFFISWLGVRVVIELKDGIIKLPEIYSMNIEPAINQIFDNTAKMIAKLDPMLVQAIQNIAASLSQSAGTVVSNISSTVIGFMSSSASSLPGLLLGIIFTVISSLFFAMDYSKITGYFVRLFPAQNRNLFSEINKFAAGIGFKYVKAYAILMAVTFAELALGLSILRVDKAILVAALIAVIDLLPVLGTGGVMVPWIIVELIKGNIPFAIGLAVLYLIIIIVRNILEPKLIGKQIGLHPLVMLMCMYVGLKLFGFIGLFALPVAVVIAKQLYDNDKIHYFGNSRIRTRVFAYFYEFSDFISRIFLTAKLKRALMVSKINTFVSPSIPLIASSTATALFCQSPVRS
jgi:sporulation integral membrane protein YtvI